MRDESSRIDHKKFMKLIKSKGRDISNLLVKKHFLVQLGYLPKNLKELKNNPEKNKQLVIAIKSGLSDFKNEIENITEEEKRIQNHMK